MKFRYAILEWIEVIQTKSIQDIYEMAVDEIIPWELYAALCELAGQCVGI